MRSGNFWKALQHTVAMQHIAVGHSWAVCTIYTFNNTVTQSVASTHKWKQAAFPCSSLEDQLCTRTFHVGFVGSFGRWVMQHYHQQQQLDSPHHRRSSTPVGLVGCTTPLKWALVLWLAHSTLSHSPRRSGSRSMVSQTGHLYHTAGRLHILKWEKAARGAALRQPVHVDY